MSDRYLLISADGHAGPPAELYRDYLEERYRSAVRRAPGRAVRPARPSRSRTRSSGRSGRPRPATAVCWPPTTPTPATRSSTEKVSPSRCSSRTPTCSAPDASASSPFGSGLGSPVDVDPELVMAGARAHNRWLADFCAKQSDRRVGVAVVPITCGVELALTEIEAVHELGLRGVMIPTRWMNAPAYHEERYEPVWTLLEELGMVLHTHSGAGSRRLRHRSRLHGDLRDRGVLVGGPPAVGAAVVRACSSAIPASSTSSPRTVRGGCPTS